MIGSIVSVAFQLYFMALAVSRRGGPSNKKHCQLQPKKIKVTLYYIHLYDSKRLFTQPSLLTG